MVIEENKALVRRFVEDVINGSRPAALDELLSESYAYHAPGMEIVGSEGMRIGALPTPEPPSS